MEQFNKIAIWGFGREGISSYKYLKLKYPSSQFFIISNDGKITDDAIVLDDKTGSKQISSGYFDLVVKSPGISLYRPEIKQAKQKGAKFTSATNIWFNNNKKTKTIAITGTKGKSTTSNLIYHILKSNGFDVTLAGNIGRSLLDSHLPKDYMIIELSSYQIADMEHYPDYLVITNLYPEHGPWHNGVENYYKDKLKLTNGNKETIIIANEENEELTKRLKNKSSVNWFNTINICNSAFPLKGTHNIENLAATLKLLDCLGIKEHNLNLERLEPLPHRLQEFGKIENTLCVNDSISTIPQTTLAALKVYKDYKIFLIMGGLDRGQDYTSFTKELSHFDIGYIATLPETGEKIQNSLKNNSPHIKTASFPNLSKAFSYITKNLPENSVLILSPAAPSFIEHNNFEERGNHFMNLCISHPKFIKIKLTNTKNPATNH